MPQPPRTRPGSPRPPISRTPAQEAQRHVQRLPRATGRSPVTRPRIAPAARPPAPSRAAPGRSRATNSRARAPALAQEATAGLSRRRARAAAAPRPLAGQRPDLRLAAEQPPQQVHRHGGRALADVGPSPGRRTLRVIRPAVPGASPGIGADREAHQPDRLLLGAAVRPGDPGDADPDLGAEALTPRRRPAPRRPRSRRRRTARSARGRPRPVRSWPGWNRRRCPPAKYAEEPGRSVSRAAISPPVHDSATATVRARQQRAPPARRPSSRRGRTACRRGARR